MARKKKLDLPPSRPEVIAFLRDAKENPDDDTPRLILADWLEDRGDPRGEYVRMAVEVYRKGNPYDYSPDGLLGQCLALERKHKADWVGVLAPRTDISFGRGLVHVDVFPGSFFGPTWRQLAGSEQWEWVEFLHIRDSLDSHRLDQLLDSPLLPSIGGWQLDVEDETSLESFKRLMHSPAVARLRLLWLTWDADSERAAELGQIIASSSALAGLQRLFIEVPHFCPEGVRSIGDSPFLGRLRTLRFDGSHIGSGGLQILSNSPHLAHISSLSVRDDNLDIEAIRSLIASRHLGQLKTLELMNTDLSPSALQLLRNAPQLKCVELMLG